jgi:hypothetical protein
MKKKDPSRESRVKLRLLTALLSASVMLVCGGRLAAQTDSGKPAANIAARPSGTRFPGAAIGSVNIDRMMIGAQLSDVMQLGSAERKEPGIKFVTGPIRAAPGFPGGSLRWLQTCRPDRWREDNAGHWTHFTSDGPRLDQGAPSKCDDSGGAVASPAVILGDGYKVQTVYDEYTTTLMYQVNIPNSIPVPIVSFWWYWTGVSTRMGAKWKLTKAGTSGNPRANMHPSLPTWTGVMDGLGYK